MIQFGIIGAGNIAHSFAAAAKKVDGMCVSAVASKDMQRAKDFAAIEGIEQYYGEYDKMLANPHIDAVYIATTGNYHYDNIMQCLHAGKHVICEKAMVATVAEARQVFALAKEKKCFVMEGMWSRFLPKTQKVREWIKEGTIGEVVSMQATIGFHPPRDMQSRLFNPKLGGGALYDLGVYLIDLLPYFVDQEIAKVQSYVKRAPSGVDETVHIDMRLSGGIMVNGQMSLCAIMPEDAYIYGEKGYIRVPKIHFGTEAMLYDAKGKLAEHFDEPEAAGFVYEIREAVRCINERCLESSVASWKMTLQSSQVYEECLAGTAPVQFRQVFETETEEIARLSGKAQTIVKEHYDPIIGEAQNDYMIEMFQSPAGITKQIKEGQSYYEVLQEGEIAGFIAMYPKEGKMYLNKFYLEKERRGMGCGRKMMNFVCTQAKKQGFDKVFLNVNKYNQSSIDYYKHMGFYLLREEKNPIGNGYYMDDYVLEKDISV